ncbi:hypothetical protein L218DRAFT_818874, partial [Marasmius fiardii PR-910]
GNLRVLLATCHSKSLRTQRPGETALPGGRKDEKDQDQAYTALRKADEEKKTVTTTSSIRILCTLEPVVSLNRRIVTPIVTVAFLEDPTIIDTLCPSEEEVPRIFMYPLEAILNPT